MQKKTQKNTKSKIITAAWKLFYEQGYEDTTVEDIIFESHTSKGSFYHYFDGKDALLGTLSSLFDERYEELANSLDAVEGAFEKLIFLNKELFLTIENSVPIELLAMLYSSQLVTRGERHLLDRRRTYYKLLRRIVSEGQANGELTNAIPIDEIVKIYALIERGFIYDWCICNGEYSLSRYSHTLLPDMIKFIIK